MTAAESFGRYELIKLVGSGGMAHVHLARQLGPRGFVKPCVLKRIAPEARRHPSVHRMFIEEARISALLNHPNIVQTFDYGDVDGTPYMALELIDGVNLAQFCRMLAKKKRWLPVRPAVDVCLKLLDALQYAHDLTDLDGRPLRIVHRDVSPQNALLSRQGVVKLADFGIARHEARDTHTRVGESAKGKPGYMAPEQAMGDTIDGRADLFSVGILLTELVSARRVMAQGQRPVGVLGIADRIRHLFTYRPEAPRELESIAQRLCALDPNQRPATAAQAAAELQAAMANESHTHSLDQFLKQVFQQHMPDDTLGAALNYGTHVSPSPPPPIPTPGPQSDPAGAGFTDDPTEGQIPTGREPVEAAHNAVRTAWARPEPGEADEGTSQVYGGWPKQFLPDRSPKLEFVARATTMEAMEHFAPEESEEVRERWAAQKAPPRPTSGLPPPLGPPAGPPGSAPTPTPAPFQDPVINRALKLMGGTPTAPPPTAPAPTADLTPNRAPARRSKGRPAQMPPVVPLALAGLAVVIGGLIVVSLASDDRGSTADARFADTGQLTVTSDPPGANIFVEHQDVGAQTPKTLAGLPIDQPIHIAVRLPRHRTTPRDLTVKIPVLSGQTSAHFRLRPGRVFTLNSDPTSAAVTVNGERLTHVTPLKLETIPFGDTATITLEQDGYLPKLVHLKATKEAPEAQTVALEPAIKVDVLSEPPGATVFIDGMKRGLTPLYEVLVPKSRRFRVVLRKPGFKKWSRRVRPKQVASGSLVAELSYLPFMSLPMSRSERGEARRLLQEVGRIEQAVRVLRRQLRKAQRRLESLEARPAQLIGPIAEAQRNVDLVRDELTKQEDALNEAKSKQEVFRDQLLLKAEMEN